MDGIQMQTVGIHLDSEKQIIQVWGYTPFGERPELNFLVGLTVIQRSDYYELEKIYLFDIISRLLKSGQKYTITGI